MRKKSGLSVPEHDGIWVPNVEIEIWRDGRHLDTLEVKNTFTTAGKAAYVDQQLASPTLSKTGWMAVGTGSPAANALGTETSRQALTAKTRSTNVLTMSADFAPGVATATLTEAGTFDASSVGNMHHSTTFSLVKDALMDLVINWTWTLN